MSELLPLILLDRSFGVLAVEEGVSAVREQWRLTREGFDSFLLSLDPDREKAGRRYELLRSNEPGYQKDFGRRRDSGSFNLCFWRRSDVVA